jgi:hypothetical protein
LCLHFYFCYGKGGYFDIKCIEVTKGVTTLKETARKISPEDYLLSVLSPEDRLDAAFRVAGEAFKKSKLTVRDVENAVKVVRRKAYEKKK